MRTSIGTVSWYCKWWQRAPSPRLLLYPSPFQVFCNLLDLVMIIQSNWLP